MMRRLLLTSSMLSAAMALTACATTPAPDPASPSDRKAGVDHQYVGTVNAQARRLGTRVIWVNLPREKDRRKPDD